MGVYFEVLREEVGEALTQVRALLKAWPHIHRWNPYKSSLFSWDGYSSVRCRCVHETCKFHSKHRM